MWWLKSSLQAVVWDRASARIENSTSFRNLSRRRNAVGVSRSCCGAGSRRRARMLMTTGAGMDALIHGLSAGRLGSLQAVTRHAARDPDHMAVAIIAALQLAPDRGHGWWQDPVPERGTVAQHAGFGSQNRHIVPRIIDRLASAEGAGMFANQQAILANGDTFCIGMHVEGTSHGGPQDGIPVVVDPLPRPRQEPCPDHHAVRARQSCSWCD